MDYRFSNRYNNISGSAIRAIFELLKDPSIISFAGGMPASECFPSELLSEYATKLLKENPSSMLQYGVSNGYAPLIKTLGKIYNVDSDQVLITTGAQQAIDLIAKSFLDKGDTILVENPTFLGSLQTFNLYEPNVVPVNTDENGLVIDDLIKKIEEYNPKLLYVIPTFQNPSGKTYSNERRSQISEIATKYNLVVIEDDPYSSLRYDGEKQNSIFSYNKTGHIIYVTSFSKTIAPGIRVGAAIANKQIINKLVIGTQSTTVHTNMLSQAITNEFINSDHYSKHIENMCNLYKSRRDLMIKLLKEYMPKEVTYNIPSGGLFIWCELSKNIDANEVFKKAVENKVAFVPGSPFYCENPQKNTMRLNFSASTPEQIEKGIITLSKVIKEYLGEKN